MPTINITDLEDGTNATAGQINAIKSSILTLVNGKLDTANVASGGIDTVNIAVGAVTAEKIEDETITGAKLVDGTITDTQLASNVVTVASESTIAPSNTRYFVTALATNATITAPSYTPTNGKTLVIRIKDNGTARTLSFTSDYTAVGVTLPTTTVANKVLYIGAIYNSATSKHDVISISREA